MTTIAIDGPSGSGKSTLGSLLGDRLGLECLDTGAMYRAVALLALRTGTDPEDADALTTLSEAMSLELGAHVTLDGEDVTARLRSFEVTAIVSPVATHPGVRRELVRRQREWVATRGGGVVEGRDIGSVVLPDADVKVFLTADPAERARRRAAEAANNGGGGAVDFHLASMAERDVTDSTRADSPLVAVTGAITVDSTATPPEVIVELVIAALERQGPNGGSEVVASSQAVKPAATDGDLGGPSPVRPPGRGELAFYALCRAFVVGASKVYFPGGVSGGERLPRKGSYILAPVHRSYVDWLVAARVTRRRLRFVVKAEVWKVAAVGRLIEALGAFPIHRGSADRESLARCLEVLSVGEPLVVFPEGTRQHGLEVQELLEGAAYMALRANVPIYPVGLAGTEESMPRGKKFPRPKRVRIVIGEPLAPHRPDPQKRVSRRETTELTGELRSAIQVATDRARADLVREPKVALVAKYRRKGGANAKDEKSAQLDVGGDRS